MISEASVPLAVDLDGTLVLTDTLFENTTAVLRRHPLCVLAIPFWVARGRTVFKTEIARRAQMDVTHLPWRRDLLDFINAGKLAGRTIVLATGADEATANAVALHLGVFDEVFASHADINLKGQAKRDALVSRFGKAGFDYVGDSRADIPVWAASRVAHVAGRKHALPASASGRGEERGRIFASPRATLRSWIRLIRVHQWLKNTLLFGPVLLSHRVTWQAIGALATAFLAFSFVASGIYIVNDLFDLDEDRRHRRNCRRPLANGEISITQGIAVSAGLLAVGFGMGAWGGAGLEGCLIVYFGLAVSYTVFLKNKPILDVVALAFLYTLRTYTGGLVSHVAISPWLYEFSIFLFLSLAFVKRYSELLRLKEAGGLHAPGRGYRPPDLSIVSQAGVGSGLLAGLVLALYVNGEDVHALYPRPALLWGISPLFLYWMIRVWLIAHRGNMHEDPLLYAFKDKVSYFVGALIVLMAVLAATLHAG